MLDMQLVTNADPDKYGSLIDRYDRDFLSGENKYTKTPLNAYNLLKGWNNHQHPRGPTKVGLSFNNNGEEDGTALVNDGNESKKKCPRCSRNNHKLADCIAKTHYDGTVLHVMCDIEEIDKEVNSEISATLIAAVIAS